MLHLTELEQRLAAEDGAAVRTELTQRLAQTEQRLNARLTAMLPRPEFAAINTCLQATQAAQHVLDQWIVGAASRSPSILGDVARRGWPY